MAKLLIAALTFLAVYCFAITSKYFSPNRDDAKLKEVQQLAAEVPVFPEFKQVSSSSGSKDAIAGVDMRYRSRAGHDKVMNYYKQVLAEHGWLLEKEQRRNVLLSDQIIYDVTFRKSGVELLINYWDTKPEDEWHTYDFNYIWEKQ